MDQGIIIVNKPAGITSMDVVAKMRKLLHIKKIGHTGTLDPDATGVLPVCIGRAVKAVELLMNGNIKEYRTVMLLGTTTDTQDISGNVIEKKSDDEINSISQSEIEETVKKYIGDIFQLPPMYSAIKLNGRKLVNLARKGVEVEREKRQVTIYEIEIEDISLPRVTMRVRCSKGTYIRTLCEDIGRDLGCGACMEKLVRTQTDGFTLDEAHTLEEVASHVEAGKLDEIMIPTDCLFLDIPAYSTTEDKDRFVIHGNYLEEDELSILDPAPAFVRVYLSDGTFAALYEWDEERKIYKNLKMFLETELK